MNTPSYPSGHTTQAYMMSYVLSDKFPKYRSKFRELAEMVSKSRVMARAHYPSDISFGKKVAGYLVSSIND